jgi:hypothetical protein
MDPICNVESLELQGSFTIVARDTYGNLSKRLCSEFQSILFMFFIDRRYNLWHRYSHLL